MSPEVEPRGGAAGRNSEEIRRDIELQRAELSKSVQALRGRVTELTDWRSQAKRHRREIMTGVAIAGFIAGGLFMLRRR